MRLRFRHIAYIVAIGVIIILAQYHFNLGAKQLTVEVISMERNPNDGRELRLNLASDVDPRSLPYYSQTVNIYLSCAESGPANSLNISNFPEDHDFDGYWQDGRYYFSVLISFYGPRVDQYSAGRICELVDVPTTLADSGCIACEYVFAFFPRHVKRNISCKSFCMPVSWIRDAVNEGRHE